ncbi:MAG: hypothetical protein QMC77_00060 [Methanocellales archaeon]|nr:hypothetical protein [Methanocellales archaeon]
MKLKIPKLSWIQVILVALIVGLSIGAVVYLVCTPAYIAKYVGIDAIEHFHVEQAGKMVPLGSAILALLASLLLGYFIASLKQAKSEAKRNEPKIKQNEDEVKELILNTLKGREKKTTR